MSTPAESTALEGIVRRLTNVVPEALGSLRSYETKRGRYGNAILRVLHLFNSICSHTDLRSLSNTLCSCPWLLMQVMLRME